VGRRALALLALLGLTLWQGWLTLGLFGPDHAWDLLCNEQPILSGRHPLHLYHGHLGSRSLWRMGRLCCFDPNFQAGYPKTPVFDSGSRPAEFFLFLTGGRYSPAAYKIGLALCWLAVPALLLMAARCAGLSRVTALLATVLGLVVWWTTPCQAALEAGKIDLLLATLAALLQVALLVRFHRSPALGTWLGVLLSGYFGWFAHPLFFALLLPLALVYYLSVGVRHQLLWHLGLLAGLAGAVASNAFWLLDWVAYWWIRAPLRFETRLLPHRTFHTLWCAPCWGVPLDRGLAVVLFLLAGVGVWLLNRQQQRPAARLLGLGALGFLALAVIGVISQPLGSLGTEVLLVPALLFAALPAAHAVSAGLGLLHRFTGRVWGTAAITAGVLLLVGFLCRDSWGTAAQRCTTPTPLTIGLSRERTALIETLQAQTTPEARILWEDRSSRRAERWTALLPLLTERAYLSGLDPDAGIEHAYANFTDQVLAGRPLQDWSDADLEAFCRCYNVGWVVCWSRGAVKRFHAWPVATAIADVQDQGEAGTLFQLQRTRSFARRGQVQWLRADCQRIVLGDVVPEGDEVGLSLHYQPGLEVSPAYIRIERELDPYDPIPFVRLRLPGPTARITLSWPGP
jgi:hypothetical protein